MKATKAKSLQLTHLGLIEYNSQILVHSCLDVHGALEETCIFMSAQAFFHAACSCGKFTCSYDKTSTETPDAYLR